MCDRKIFSDELTNKTLKCIEDNKELLNRLRDNNTPKVLDDLMDRLTEKAIYELKSEMAIEDVPFGYKKVCAPVIAHKDCNVKELGKALVRANQLGLRIIKGGK